MRRINRHSAAQGLRDQGGPWAPWVPPRQVGGYPDGSGGYPDRSGSYLDRLGGYLDISRGYLDMSGKN